MLRYSLFFIYCCYFPCVLADNSSTSYSLRSFAYSEPTSIAAFYGDWDGQLYRGNSAFAFLQTELSFSIEQWQIGLLYKLDYFTQFHPDTARLIHDTRNKKPLQAGEHYKIDLSANFIHATGLRLSKLFSTKHFDITLGASYLSSSKFVDGSLAGSASAIQNNDYDYRFDVDYAYSKDVLFERKNKQPSGHGVTFDIDTHWRVSSNWKLNLEVADVYSKIYWHNAPVTQAIANSNNKEYDEDGYVIYNPVISGIETFQSRTQKLIPKIYLRSSYLFNNIYAFLLELQRFNVEDFFIVGYGIKHNSAQTEFHYNATANAVGIRYRSTHFNIEFISDDIETDKARTLGLNVTLSTQF